MTTETPKPAPVAKSKPTSKTDKVTAADIARELGIAPKQARAKLRAAGLRAPYEDRKKIIATLKSK